MVEPLREVHKKLVEHPDLSKALDGVKPSFLRREGLRSMFLYLPEERVKDAGGSTALKKTIITVLREHYPAEVFNRRTVFVTLKKRKEPLEKGLVHVFLLRDVVKRNALEKGKNPAELLEKFGL
ncbi:MAG: hypothetical protein NTY90_00785 [Candidatus Micrarchaeota archaeon]|nr:hypothetical protein [Candidatus Micrarchaeota archaeon]